MNTSPVFTDGWDRKKIFEETKWIEYILCYGCGIGAIQPLLASDVKQLCFRQTASTTDVGGEYGFVNTLENCLCFTRQCAFPPAKGTHPCMICNKPFGEKRGEGSSALPLNPDLKELGDDLVSDKTFWLYYLFCVGVGINKSMKPLFAMQGKELCCQGSNGLEDLSTDGVFFSQMTTQLCIWHECRLPPAPGNPKCAICTWKMNKDHTACGA